MAVSAVAFWYFGVFEAYCDLKQFDLNLDTPIYLFVTKRTVIFFIMSLKNNINF